MIRYFTVLFLLSFGLAMGQAWRGQSNAWNAKSEQSGRLLNGVALGFLVQGQTHYPTPYHGPKVEGIFNDGAYHLFIDFYLNRWVVGVQVAEEFLFLEKVAADGSVWKPRGFNGSFSSKTRSWWLSLGVNVWKNLYLKSSFGVRSGPSTPLLHRNKTAADVALGFDFADDALFYNTVRESEDGFSETDVLLSLNYPITVAGANKIAPELGYSVRHGGLTLGGSYIYSFD